jgi:hypothetical protein
MNNKVLGFLAVGLLVGPVAAHAQTYDLDIAMMPHQGSTPIIFTGSFKFNSGGTCFGSAAFCPGGSTPDFTNVKISDPLSIDSPGRAFAFTDVTGGVGGLTFLDTYFGTAGKSSSVYALEFSINAPLGGTATTIGLNNVLFTTDFNVTGTLSCGGPDRLPNGGVTCTTAALTKAPEIDAISAASALTLLLGGLTVLRGRRKLES